MSIERHYFPGNNTPMGFYSYYRYILGQREANKIICIKGGPGTGKSTFMKKIADSFKDTEDIDYLHCSADEGSLDGILLKNKKIALIDGTSPHIIDPVTPGAVDKIINLGEYWNEDAIAINKEEIIDLNEETSKWYRIAYNYLNAAKSVYRSLEEIYNNAVESSEVYRIAADVIVDIYSNKAISFVPGKRKKFFASAITGNGNVNFLNSLLKNMRKIYLINSPVGFSNNSFMEIITEGAIYRGLDIEEFYCSICPEEKIEHLLIPELATAFITLNEYHDIEPWEITEYNDECQEIVLIDMNDYMNQLLIGRDDSLILMLKEEFDILMNKGYKYLNKAKEVHMKVESMYIPNMNFTEISDLLKKVQTEINIL